MHDNELIKRLSNIREEVDEVWSKTKHDLNVIENKLHSLIMELMMEQNQMLNTMKKDETRRS